MIELGNIINAPRKGKPDESQGRKVMGLKHLRMPGYSENTHVIWKRFPHSPDNRVARLLKEQSTVKAAVRKVMDLRVTRENCL